MALIAIAERVSFDTIGGARAPYYVTDDNNPPNPVDGIAAQLKAGEQFRIDNPQASAFLANIIGEQLSAHSWRMVCVVTLDGGTGGGSSGGDGFTPYVHPPVKDEGAVELDLDFSYQMQPFHITTSRQRIWSSPNALDTKNLINAYHAGGSATLVLSRGLTVMPPPATQTFRFFVENSAMSTTLRAGMRKCMGKLNSTLWQGVAPYTGVIVGLDARQRNKWDWEIAIDVSIKDFEQFGQTLPPDIGGIIVSGAPPFSGHDYYWSYNGYRLDDDGEPVVMSKGVYIDRVLPEADYDRELAGLNPPPQP